MYMKRFIEKLYGRLYGRKFRTGFYFEVMTFTILTFISIVLYLNLYFNKDSYGEYKSYYNITVEIKDGRINGKLNKYIEIKTICVILKTADFLMKGSSGCHLLNFGRKVRRYMFSKAVLMTKKIASII